MLSVTRGPAGGRRVRVVQRAVRLVEGPLHVRGPRAQALLGLHAVHRRTCRVAPHLPTSALSGHGPKVDSLTVSWHKKDPERE